MLNAGKFTFVILLILDFAARAQVVADTTAAKFNYEITSEGVDFDAELRPLRQVAGAPEAFYSYFWEFGDGSFSFGESPVHAYAQSGLYDVRLFATNNYDDGKAPPTRARPVKQNKELLASNTNSSSYFEKDEAIKLKTNRMPKPNESMLLLLGYKNTQPVLTGGSLVVFFNENRFKNKNFVLKDARTYHQEERVDLQQLMAGMNTTAYFPPKNKTSFKGPAISDFDVDGNYRDRLVQSLLNEKMLQYGNNVAFRFAPISPQQERFIFLELGTTPEMIKDTNAVVTLTGIFIPDDPSSEVQQYDLELQIVASHDPNKMQLKNHRMNYRFTGKNREFVYKVRFQNTGKGPASLIKVGVDIPPVLDPHSVKVLDYNPHCLPCDSVSYNGQSCLDTLITADSLYFVFKNIYLSGLRQEGVDDRDSTKGFVEYSIRFKQEEKIKKLPFKSSARIFFDKNPPIYTNKAAGRFKPGISPAIMGAYSLTPGHNGEAGIANNHLLLGLAVSPYSPYRKYLQAELFLERMVTDQYVFSRVSLDKDTVIDKQFEARLIAREHYKSSNSWNINLVPVHLRYNLNNWIGIGTGAWFNVEVSQNSSTGSKLYYQQRGAGDISETKFIDFGKTSHSEWFTSFKPALFADVQVGKVRVGPALGLRYLQFFNGSQPRLLLYGIWRF